MKLVFMGTPQFSVPSLEALISGDYQIQAVVTQPDRRRGRGHKLRYSPIKEVALAAGLPVLQPERVSEQSFVERLLAFSPDVIVVVAFGQLIPPAILNMPPHGCINVHASLLPKYRGASPIQQVIIDGCQKTGVTTMLLDEGWDTGDILLQRELNIEAADTAETLEEKLAQLGAKLLTETLDRLAEGNLKLVPQDDAQASYAHRLTKECGQVSWDASTDEIVNLVRGVVPWPGAFTSHRGELLKIWKASSAEREVSEAPGTILGVVEDGIEVATGSGCVCLEVVQPANRPRMRGRDYANGYHVEPGEIVGGSSDEG
ncbi:MAG: methionyl-tRNA formyltransferase [Firmicutes bacterium]|nr:methionyl-tRNA formyltransferase [Bacillota bacterium]